MSAFWLAFPFVRFTFFFIAGILCAIYFNGAHSLALIALCVSFGIFALLKIWLPVSRKQRFVHYQSALAYIFLFAFGYYILHLNTDTRHNNHIRHCEDTIDFFMANVVSEAEDKGGYLKVLAQVKKIKTRSGWKTARGKVLLYVEGASSSEFRYGYTYLIKAAPISIKAPSNPEEFDYAKYLSYKNVFHRAYVKKGAYTYLAYHPSNFIVDISLRIRNYLDGVLANLIQDKTAYAVTTALVLGVRNEMDNSLRQAYTSAGVMHVLAVSGMHVALIYSVLVVLLGSMKKIKHGNIIFTMSILCALWLYALITGFTPSVLRAVCMFSFVVLAKSINRNTNIYNTLAISAFVLLCLNPYLIVDVGFQLSYVAVAGIVFIYGKLYHLREYENPLKNHAWSILCVTIAAQIATFPLTIFYFHQFPVYFLFTNLIIIPLSTCILYAGIATLLLSLFMPLGKALAYITEKLVYLMNRIILIVEKLPYHVIDKIYISWLEVIIIYGIIVAVFLFIHTRKKIFFHIYTVFILCIVSWQYVEILMQNNQSKLAVFHIKQHTAIAFVQGRSALLLCDSLLVQNEEKLHYHVYPYLNSIGVKYPKVESLKSATRIAYSDGKNFLCYFKGLLIGIFLEKPKSNVANNIKVNYAIGPAWILKKVKADTKIASLGYPKRYDDVHIHHYVTSCGAFIKNLSD
ncbi:MAG: ComEC family competence protein [Cytophagaceae bacterium]|nr:ComEC family competence protein [Cytophagaceae bacterium]MDW8456573.1 ComEC/Rec2 family competence protein [Cytophagaceae bacterium]